MAKSLKLQISRVINTTFQSCRSKDPSILPQEPRPVPTSILLVSTIDPKLISVDIPPAAAPPPSRPSHNRRSSSRRHVSSAVISVGCGFTSKSDVTQDSDGHTRSRSSQEFRWQKEEKWHVVEETQTPRCKTYNSSASGDNSDNDDILALPAPPRPLKSKVERKKRRGEKKRVSAKFRTSTSSVDSGLFSSEVGDEREEDEETETLISSSRSFTTDSSSEFNPHLETIREAPSTRRHRRSKIKAKKLSTRVSFSENIYRPSSVSSAAEGDSPARLSVFKKLIPCSVDGKVKESFAITKKSKDPYEDFKRSMMEMILEKQMFEEKDLEQLLQCFLSLNSKHYHGLIVEAFTEIWQAMFSSSARTSAHHSRVNSRGS